MSEATNEELHRQIRAYEATVHNMQLRLDEAIAERDALDAANREWSEKTAWLQKTAQPHELGLHLADVLRLRIEKLEADLEAVGAGGVQKLAINLGSGWKLKGDRIPVLYTDEINGQQVCRDDLWLCKTTALALPPPTPATQPAVVAGWAMVPLEPTKRQVKAATDAWLDCASKLILNKALAALRAGIAAAPIAGESNE
jgi:hypothetical protein